MVKTKEVIILELLRRENKITPAQFDDALNMLEDGDIPRDKYVEDGTITAGDATKALMLYSNTPYVDLDSVEIEVDVTSLFGIDLLAELQFIPIYEYKDHLMIVGAVDPINPVLIQLLNSNLNSNYQMVRVDKDKLDSYLNVFRAQEKAKKI